MLQRTTRVIGVAILSLAGSCKPDTKALQTDAPSSLPTGAGELVYVSNEDSRNLTVIDAATDR